MTEAREINELHTGLRASYSAMRLWDGPWRVYVGKEPWPRHQASMLVYSEDEAQELVNRINSIEVPEDLTRIGYEIGQIVASYERYPYNADDDAEVNRRVTERLLQERTIEAHDVLSAINHAVIDAS